jgi:hypothetical protein
LEEAPIPKTTVEGDAEAVSKQERRSPSLNLLLDLPVAEHFLIHAPSRRGSSVAECTVILTGPLADFAIISNT